MNLQEFIEANVGKQLGMDKFLYKGTFIPTMITHPMEPEIVTVSLYWIGLDYRVTDKVDIDKFSPQRGDHVEFYYWLQDTFLPMAIQHFFKHLSPKLKENDNAEHPTR